MNNSTFLHRWKFLIESFDFKPTENQLKERIKYLAPKFSTVAEWYTETTDVMTSLFIAFYEKEKQLELKNFMKTLKL